MVKEVNHSTVSRDSSENGVSSRVEACRKRLRVVRANQRGAIETVEPVAGISVACKVEGCTEMPRSPGVIEAIAERLDEAEIT
jgi:hypothetical protein